MLVLLAGLVGQRLTGDIHEIVLEIVVATILLGDAVHQTGGFQSRSGIVVILHLRPAAGLEIVERGTTTEDALVRALLVIASRAVVDGLSEDEPSLLYLRIIHAVAGLHVVFHPIFFRELLRAPRQFAHQFEHHRIIL